MNLYDLSVNQLKRAAAIKEQIERLTKELSGVLGAPANVRAAPRKNWTTSAAVKRKISAAQKARWANLRRANSLTPAKRVVKVKKNRESARKKSAKK